MIVAIASNFPTCILHAGGDEPRTMYTEQEITTHNDKNKDEHSASPDPYKLAEHRDEQVDWHNAVLSLDENLNTNCKEELVIR